MHQQGLACFEIREQVLGPAPQRDHALSVETRMAVPRERASEVGAPRFDTFDSRAFHHSAQLASNGFDFGEFGQLPPYFLTLNFDLFTFRNRSAAARASYAQPD